jgi:O-methyltransferase
MAQAKIIENETFHRSLEAPWGRTFMALMRPSVVEELVDETAFPFSQSLPGFIREHWQSIKDKTLVDPFRLGWLIDELVRVKDVQGNLVECGSFKGGSGLLMARALKTLGIDKQVHLFDSFEGLPEPDATHDKGYKKGVFKSEYDELVRTVEEQGLQDIITIHRGWFSDTVGPFLSSYTGEISLLHIDCDLYNSTNDCFPQFYPLVAEGGAIVFDDFNDGGRGEKTAILEYLAGQSPILHVGPAPQTCMIKGELLDEQAHVAEDAGFTYSLDRLLEHSTYLNWLNDSTGTHYEDELAPFLPG